MQSALAKPRMLRRFAAILAAAALVLAAVMAAQPAQAHAADAKPVGKICFYMDSAATRPIDMVGMRDVYDVNQVVQTIKELGSATFIKSIRLELSEDWNTKGAGRIEVGEGMTFYLDLHGHMLNRAKVGSFGDKWYAEGKGEVIYVKKNGTLVVDGGTGAEALTAHNGTLEDNDNFWSYSAAGKDAILGGLITGGACDDHYGAGGISLAGDNAKAYLRNVTVAGNLTDQWDSSYGHGAGVALHGEDCRLELSNAKVDYNHAEGTGGGIYVRNNDCTVAVKGGSEVKGNLGVLGGGGIYVDGNDCVLSIEGESKIAANATHKDGGGVYFNCKRGSIDIVDGGQVTGNSSKKDGAGIYNCYNDTSINIKGADSAVRNNTATGDGGGLYLEDATRLTLSDNAKINSNKARSGAGVYVNDSDTDITLNDDSEISENRTAPGFKERGDGAGIYHNGSNGTVTLNDNAKIRANGTSVGSGGGIYNCYNGTTFTLNDNSSICDNTSDNGGGGALYLNDKATVILNGNATIANNSTLGNGGGIYIDEASTITLNDDSKLCKNYGMDGGALYVNAKTTLKLNGNGTITQNGSRQGGAAYIGSTKFVVEGQGADKSKIVENSADTKFGGNLYCWGNVTLKNVMVGSDRNGGRGTGKCADIYYNNNSTGPFDFELYGTVKLSGVMMIRDQYITGGKLEAGSSVGVYYDEKTETEYGLKIADLSLLDGLFDSEGKQSTIYSTYEAYDVEVKQKSGDFAGGLYFTAGSPDRHVTLFYGDDCKTTTEIKCTISSNVTFDGTPYKNSKDQIPVMWTDRNCRNYYPNDDGKVSLRIQDLNVNLYAVYAKTNIINIKYGDNQTAIKYKVPGATVTLAGADYKKGDNMPSSWKYTDDKETRTIAVGSASHNASFIMPSSDVTLEAQYAPDLQGFALTLGEATSYDNIGPAFSLDGSVPGVTVSSFETTDVNGGKAQPDAATLSSGLKVYLRQVSNNADGKGKQVTYSIVMDHDLFRNCGVYLDGSKLNEENVIVSVSLPQIGTVKATLDKLSGSNTLSFSAVVNYPEPSADAKSVTAKCVNTHDVAQVVATQSYKVAKDGTVTIPKPQVSGWGFYGWDTTTLPSSAKVDADTGEMTVSSPAADVEVRALLKPQASKVELEVPTLEVGESFPSALASCKVTTYEKTDITAKANSDVSFSWAKEDGSDTGDKVEAGMTYKATVTFKYSDDGREFDWLSSPLAYVNDIEATDFKLDLVHGFKAKLSYLVTVGSEATYSGTDEGVPASATLSSKDDYAKYLPNTITYVLSDGSKLMAGVTWENGLVDNVETGSLDAVGSFRDVFGGLHEVSSSFTLDALAAPKLSLKAGTYAGAQSATINAASSWGSASDVKMYYAVGAAGATSSDGLKFTECSDGTAIDIPESCTLFVYASYGDKSSLIESYSYTIKAGHVVSVASGSASDGKGNAVTSAAEGQTVRLAAADAAEGMAFDKWKVTGGTQVELKDASSASTSFTMPDGDVSVEAVYKESPDDPVVASGVDVKLPAIAAGDRLPIAAKAVLTGPSGEEIDSVAVQLQWKDTSGEALSAGSAAQAGKTYAVTAAVLLEEGAAACLDKDTAISFNGEAAKSQEGPDENGMMTASYEVKIAGAQATSVTYKGCTYTLAGGKLTLTKVNKKTKKTVTIPVKVKINGKKLKVAKIKAKAFKGTKATKLVVKSPYLTKKGVKGCLKGSKVKVVQVKAYAGKKANAKLLAKYKKLFKKANSGKKVTVR